MDDPAFISSGDELILNMVMHEFGFDFYIKDERTTVGVFNPDKTQKRFNVTLLGCHVMWDESTYNWSEFIATINFQKSPDLCKNQQQAKYLMDSM